MIDERFLTHRLRSTSTAGILTGLAAVGLFGWRYYTARVWSWDLFAIAATFIVVKLALMTYYHFTD
jgi:hypothetical protein